MEFTRVAFENAREVDPSIRIESPPPTDPATPYLAEMLDAGLADVSDVIGVHAYGGQLVDGRLDGVWRYLEERGVRKPVAISEAGAIDEYFTDGAEGRRRWFAQFAVQTRRYGVDSVLLFDLDRHDAWALAGTPAFDQVPRSFADAPFADGGFEAPADGETGWVVVGDASRPTDTSAFARGAGARTGEGHARLTDDALRRVVTGLVPGTTYTVSAWARVEPGGAAVLAAHGFDRLDGDRSATATATAGTGWQQVATTFTATSDAAVLEVSGTGAVDDVTLDPAG